MTEIRPIRKEDLSFLAEAEKQIFSDPWSFASLENYLSSPFSRGFLLLSRSLPAGYLLGNAVCGEGEIFRIAVLPEHRGHGFGKSLLFSALKTLEEEGTDRFFLEVRESNEAARGLYRAAGFTETGIRKHYYSDPAENAVLMEKLSNTGK